MKTFTDEQINTMMEDEGIDDNMKDACFAYLDAHISDDLSDFEEAYCGAFDNDVMFAQDMADSLGAIPKDATWPNNCIDWEYAARELMYDYTENEGFYFRNL